MVSTMCKGFLSNAVRLVAHIVYQLRSTYSVPTVHMFLLLVKIPNTRSGNCIFVGDLRRFENSNMRLEP